MIKGAALVLICLLVPAGAMAQGDAPYVQAVRAFIRSAEDAVRGGAADPVRRLESVYARHLDLDAIAARVAPGALWAVASADQKRRFVALLACRLAVEAARRPAVDRPQSWTVVGTRPLAQGRTVAVHFAFGQGTEEVVLFDLRDGGASPRVVEIRSGRGRLSARLAEAIARETGDPGADVEAWLARVDCRR